jgi:hypothetical protein
MFPAPMMHDENENSQNPRRVQIEMPANFFRALDPDAICPFFSLATDPSSPRPLPEHLPKASPVFQGRLTSSASRPGILT